MGEKKIGEAAEKNAAQTANANIFTARFFDRELDFRVRLFNVLAISGICISLATMVLSIATRMWANSAVSGALAVLSLGLLIFTSKTGRYQLGYGITIVTIFMLVLPFMFFTSGGYRSGMPSIFIFAVIFTILMLEGKRALLVSLLEIAEYSAICVFAYFNPQYVTHFETEAEVLTDIVFANVAVSISVGIVLYMHLKEYTYQRELLREQNERLNKRYHYMKKQQKELIAIQKGSLKLNLQKGEAEVSGMSIGLTAKEFALLRILVQNEGKELSAEELYEKVWGSSAGSDTRTIRFHITNLRKKLEAANADDFEIISVYGKGYSFVTVRGAGKSTK